MHTYVLAHKKSKKQNAYFFVCLAIMLAVESLGLPMFWLEFDYSNLGSIPFQK